MLSNEHNSRKVESAFACCGVPGPEPRSSKHLFVIKGKPRMIFTRRPYFAPYSAQGSQAKIFFRHPGINGFLGIEILLSDNHSRTLRISFHLYVNISSPVVHGAFKGIERWTHGTHTLITIFPLPASSLSNSSAGGTLSSLGYKCDLYRSFKRACQRA